MKGERWERLKELFEATRLLDAPEREAFVDRTCAADDEIRAELVSLLEAGQDAGSFLETPAAESFVTELQRPITSPLGQRFGPYRVISELGRGGMGVVYRAVRDDDAFRKEVALKLLPAELESSYFEERFRRERQILASLEHPNIARLLDGGADDEGHPYYVMELVEGVPIDLFCRERGLDLRARLELIRTVCSAIALAHSRLVVHCDLKPSNILVTADGSPKLLDFGIAKLLAPETGHPVAPATATHWLMTPEYASPEQVRGKPVTTATDVYALGVVLYELLTGRKPYDLGSRSPDEIVRAICEREVTRPSRVVARPPFAATGGETATFSVRDSVLVGSGALPDSNVRRLRRRLAGDLDTILLRALAKDPRRRYSSVMQLSEDVHRHLDERPILARPDRFAYRAGKFLRRHRTAVAAAVLVVASLVGGLVATMRQARIAGAQRAIAERRFEEVRRLASTFLFEVHDQVAPLPGSTPVRKRIVELGLEYLERLQAEAGDDVALQAELAGAYERIAEVQGGVGVANLGDADGALRSQSRALELRERVTAAEPNDLAALLALARCHTSLGDLLGAAGDREGRIQHYDAASRLRRRAAAMAPEDAEVRRALASSAWDGAQVLVDTGDLEGGLAAFEEVLQLYAAIAEAEWATAADRRSLALAHKKVGAVRSVTGDLKGALVSLSAALALDEARLGESPGESETLLDVSFDHGDLGFALLRLGRAREAVDHYERAVALRQAVSEVDPQDVRARNVLRTGRYRLAASLAVVVTESGHPCAEVLRDGERALSLWGALEAGEGLDAEALAGRERVRAAVLGCSSD